MRKDDIREKVEMSKNQVGLTIGPRTPGFKEIVVVPDCSYRWVVQRSLLLAPSLRQLRGSTERRAPAPFRTSLFVL